MCRETIRWHGFVQGLVKENDGLSWNTRDINLVMALRRVKETTLWKYCISTEHQAEDLEMK